MTSVCLPPAGRIRLPRRERLPRPHGESGLGWGKLRHGGGAARPRSTDLTCHRVPAGSPRAARRARTSRPLRRCGECDAAWVYGGTPVTPRWHHGGRGGGPLSPPVPPVTPAAVYPQGARGNDGLPGPAGPPVSKEPLVPFLGCWTPCHPVGDSGDPPKPWGDPHALLAPPGTRRPGWSPRLPRCPRLKGKGDGAAPSGGN